MACIREAEDFFLIEDEGTITGEGGISQAPPESEEPHTKFQRTIGNIFHVPDQKTQLHAAFHFSYISKSYGLLFRNAVLLHFLHDAVNCNVHVR